MKTNVRILVAISVACVAVTSASALTVTLDVSLGSPYVLGDVVFNGKYPVPSGGQEARDLFMVNQLVGMYNGTISQVAPYFLSGNSFGSPLGLAETSGDIVTPAGGISKAADGNATLTLGSGFTYLIAAYDGPNGGAAVWDISSLAAGTVLEFPWKAEPVLSGDDMAASTRYGITTWTLFNAGPPRIPDGGTTLLLLGVALSGLGLIRRKLV